MNMDIQKDKEYILGIKKYILIIAIIFVVAIFLGTILPEKSPEIKEEAKNLAHTKAPDLSKLQRVSDIFLYNVEYSFLSVVMFGIIAILSAFNNGFAIGMLFNFVGKMHGVSIVILELAPHGLIEIPALLISASIGLRIGHVWWSGKWLSREWIENMKQELTSGLRFYIRYIVPLFLIAAVIESYVSQELWNYIDLFIR